MNTRSNRDLHVSGEEIFSPPGPDLSLRSADDPEWQCSENNRNLGSTFKELPFHCQERIIQDLSVPLESLLEEKQPESSPVKLVDSAIRHFDPLGSKSEYVMVRSRTSSAKPTAKIKCPPGQTLMKDAEGNWQCVGPGAYSVAVSRSDPDPDPDPDIIEISNRSFRNGNSFGNWVDFGSVRMKSKLPKVEGLVNVTPGTGREEAIASCLKKIVEARLAKIDAERQLELDTNMLWAMGPTFLPGFDVAKDILPDTLKRNKGVAGAAAFLGILNPGKAASGLYYQGMVEATAGRLNYLAKRTEVSETTVYDRGYCENEARKKGL